MRQAEPYRVRRAGGDDLEAVEALERTCFSVDRQSRRSLRYLLIRAHALAWLCEDGTGQALGYVLVLLRRHSRVARLYSIAVTAGARRGGVARQLVQRAEQGARAAGCLCMRLELRRGNAASRGLFETLGYRITDVLAGYYPGGEDGLRMEKVLHRDGHA